MSFIQDPVQKKKKKMGIPGRDIVIKYPIVIAMSNPFVEQKINNTILSLVKKLIVEQGPYNNSKTTINGWYEIKSNERGILSLTIGNYTFNYPAAHGMTIIKSLTFNIIDGKTYELSDLFKPGSNYVKVLSDIIREQINQRNIQLLGEFKGISPNQDYYIADKCLVIYFQLYEITPYVFGFPFFPISVYEIQDIIKEDGPLGKMAIND